MASELGVDEVRAELMPEDKVTAIKDLKKQGHRVAMIGDGTQAALEAADIVLMTDDLSKIVSARAIARFRRIYLSASEWCMCWALPRH